MLQMTCLECEGMIRSPFLVEVGSITCDLCNRNVTVKDVVVTTKYFTMHRDSLLKRVRHYRVLLAEVEREKKLLENRDDFSTVAHKSLDQYHAALRELLEASRETYRLELSQELPFGIEWEGRKGDGRLLSLSTKGAAIKPKGLHGIPPQGSEAKLRFALPGNMESLSMAVKVAWISKREKAEEQSNITMGLSFIDSNKKDHSCIWAYLLAHVSAPLPLVKSTSILAIP